MEAESPYELAVEAAHARRTRDRAAQLAIEQAYARMEQIVPPTISLVETESTKTLE